MNISNNLKQRFVKDTGLPIKVFNSPYFESRLNLFESQFGAKTKFSEFVHMLSENFESEAEFFNEQDRVKQAALDYLSANSAMMYFSREEDMSRFTIKNTGYPNSGVFKDCHVGKYLLSIDMKKANFTALRHYNASIFDDAETYEDFIGKFTNSEYIKQSKYIRQVIFGQINPKRQQTYERYLMDIILASLLIHTPIERNQVLYFGSDEIVIDVSQFVYDGKLDKKFSEAVKSVVDKACYDGINVRSEYYQLGKIEGTKGYFKLFVFETAAKGVEFKGLDSIEFPFATRSLLGLIPHESDYIFIHEGKLAKLLNPIEVNFNTSRGSD
jgi:hypothetical protein